MKQIHPLFRSGKSHLQAEWVEVMVQPQGNFTFNQLLLLRFRVRLFPGFMQFPRTFDQIHRNHSEKDELELEDLKEHHFAQLFLRR